MLLKFWKLNGKPSSGRLFNSKMGQKIDVGVTFHQVTKMAKNLGWNTLPTRHTFRVSMTIFLAANGMDRDRICDALGWSYETSMIRRYLSNHLQQAKDGPAALIANVFNDLDSVNIFKSYN